VSKEDNPLVMEQDGKTVIRPKVVKGCAFWATFLFLALLFGGIGSVLFPIGTIVGIVLAWFAAVYGTRESENIDAVVQAAKDISRRKRTRHRQTKSSTSNCLRT
jgi:hypothetical protein